MENTNNILVMMDKARFLNYEIDSVIKMIGKTGLFDVGEQRLLLNNLERNASELNSAVAGNMLFKTYEDYIINAHNGRFQLAKIPHSAIYDLLRNLSAVIKRIHEDMVKIVNQVLNPSGHGSGDLGEICYYVFVVISEFASSESKVDALSM